jgi:Domain of unknown function DUF29
MKTAELYDLDFAEWARQNAELLRSGRASEADLEHIAEEIEDIGKRQRHALHNRSVRLMEHLLKWEYQPGRRSSSWRRTMVTQRAGIRRLLDENPSFRPAYIEVVNEAYREAARIASIVTGRPQASFAQTCPWTIEQLLDDEFIPGR